jgi:hypothetical protein
MITPLTNRQSTGEPMTSRARKLTTKHSKSKRRSAPLKADTFAARRSKLRTARMPLASGAGLNPTAMFEFMGRVTAAYVELPYRLAQCRSLMDLWSEQARFAQRILSVTEVSAPRRTPSGKRKSS